MNSQSKIFKMISQIDKSVLTNFLAKELHINKKVAPIVADELKNYSKYLKYMNEVSFAPADDVPRFPLQQLVREPEEWPYDDATVNLMNRSKPMKPIYGAKGN